MVDEPGVIIGCVATAPTAVDYEIDKKYPFQTVLSPPPTGKLMLTRAWPLMLFLNGETPDRWARHTA